MIYWCEKCSEPVFDKKLHELTCKGKLKKLSEGSICNPVFVQERKLLSKIVGEDLTDKRYGILDPVDIFMMEKFREYHT